jgi:hypothetical protein
METLWQIAWFGPATIALAVFVALTIWLAVCGLRDKHGRSN